ncbi:Glyoxalase-like domain-containing protein [Microlunatus sagamiharensis]|uniref:Glyoxalase-like domain-containing protein n=2 Tax=Microlunatus sagamiharensis TaxID=546874 RepID=A0A1H2NH77_9ACTN|nr:Glyoxalase-like domain-containing protein [Microlunatus sagamiharensis]
MQGTTMQLDHLAFAAGPEGLDETTRRLGGQLGARFVDGGFHPRFGTQNRILPLAGGQYLEVVEVLDHPAAEKAPFGQAVRARSEDGGGWLGWVVSVSDVAPFEQRLGRTAVDGSRFTPDNHQLRWRQLGVKGLQSDPQLPFFVQWLSDPASHPSAGGGDIALSKLEIAGDHDRVDEWLGGKANLVLDHLDIEWVAPNGQPGIVAAVFATPNGLVRL